VLVQAGSSETGRELAAKPPKVVFTAQPSLAPRAGVLRRPQGAPGRAMGAAPIR
jgi:alkanesulfonate monooxygenase SsuD/methylene tetrahydromethanopterin reductase-like flavin-dependent oxidoreductase (luciferase family)